MEIAPDATAFTPPPLQHGREKVLFRTQLVLAVLAWIGLTVVTAGAVWVFALLCAFFYLLVRSAFIARLRGNAAEVTPGQFPDLHARYLACCEKLGIAQPPSLYLRNSGDAPGTLATRFMGGEYLVLNAGLVDAVADEPGVLDFCLGRELGRVRLKHMAWDWVLMPVGWLPLLGSAYRRAQEYSCDLHGSACCDSGQAVVDAVALLAVGPARWKTLDRGVWLHQLKGTGGFWMSFHELTTGQPWLTRRLAQLLRARGSEDVAPPPSRNPFAYLPALLVPRFGNVGAAGSILIVIAILAILVAASLPFYLANVKTAQAAKAGTDFESAIRGLEEMAPESSDEGWPEEQGTWSPEDATTEVPVAENWLELYEKLLEANATPETQEAARQQFFMMHIAPTLDAGTDVNAAYAAFAAEYALPVEEGPAMIEAPN